MYMVGKSQLPPILRLENKPIMDDSSETFQICFFVYPVVKAYIRVGSSCGYVQSYSDFTRNTTLQDEVSCCEYIAFLSLHLKLL